QPLSTPPSPPRFISACLTLLCPTARPPPDTYTLSLHDALPIFLDAAPAVDLGQVLGDGREQGDDVGRVHRPVCGARDVVADEDGGTRLLARALDARRDRALLVDVQPGRGGPRGHAGRDQRGRDDDEP